MRATTPFLWPITELLTRRVQNALTGHPSEVPPCTINSFRVSTTPKFYIFNGFSINKSTPTLACFPERVHLPTMDIPEERPNSPTNLDDLFDYDVGLEDIFQGKDNTSNNDTTKSAGDPSSLGLGLDEEVKITKKRQPVAKLDETR